MKYSDDTRGLQTKRVIARHLQRNPTLMITIACDDLQQRARMGQQWWQRGADQWQREIDNMHEHLLRGGNVELSGDNVATTRGRTSFTCPQPGGAPWAAPGRALGSPWFPSVPLGSPLGSALGSPRFPSVPLGSPRFSSPPGPPRGLSGVHFVLCETT